MLSIITAASLVLATAMTTVAWRLVREERRRASARVAALEAALGRDLPLEPPLEHPTPERPARGVPSLFDRDVATVARPSRTAAGIALAVFLVGSGAALAVVLSGPSPASRASGLSRPGAPLELVALGHEREGDALAIHGVVRNPPGGSPVTDLTAVVFLFDRNGRFTTSARAPIDNDDLAPGAESRFNIVAPSAGDVARYRVSFRTDRGIVAHVDRRGAVTEASR